MELWFAERETDHMRVEIRIDDVLFRRRSEYQDVCIVESRELGRMLVLDGIIQTSMRDEFVYHEMLAHVPLFIHPKPERVLVIGGGDGGTVREVLKHPEVKRVHLVEIDALVVEASKRYLPELAGKLDDPRVEVKIADGIEFVKNRRQAYDVVLIDSSDPLGPAEGLFTSEFYGNVAAALKKDGVMAAQSESPFFTPGLVESIYRSIRSHFATVRLYTASVPTYSSGPWGFMFASKRRLDSIAPRRTRPQMKTRYYTPDVHKAAFVLPRYMDERFREAGEQSQGVSTA